LRKTLVFIQVVGVNPVHHVHDLGYHGNDGVTRTGHREAHKHEGPDQGGSVIPALAEAEDDVLTAQLLLCILQQGDQALLGPLRQDAVRDLHVQVAVPENGLPADLVLAGQVYGEAQVSRHRNLQQRVPAVIYLCQLTVSLNKQAFSTDRGLCTDPHAAALCHE